MGLVITPRIRQKLSEEHQVAEEEICQCFANRTASTLEDIRVENHTVPPTRWFISETEMGRRLKIVFIKVDADIIIKTAYQPNQEEERIYSKFAISR